MAQAVRRDMHKMKAFVRFRTIAGTDDEPGPLHVAWFEPEHHIVEATAPFFARRFTQMRWAILTPERSVRWDGERFGSARARRRDQAPPADAGEELWLTYYQQHLQSGAAEARRRCRRRCPGATGSNLPEAPLIAPLAAEARRTQPGHDRQRSRPCAASAGPRAPSPQGPT